MADPSIALAPILGCSELAAREICAETTALAKHWVAIHDAYSLDHVLAAKRAVKKAALTATTKEFKGSHQERQEAAKAALLKRNRRALPRAALVLMDHTRAAYDTKQRLRTAVQLAQVSNRLTFEEQITATLTVLHNAHRLPQPEKARDGRLAYASLRRDDYLLKEVGGMMSY